MIIISFQSALRYPIIMWPYPDQLGLYMSEDAP